MGMMVSPYRYAAGGGGGGVGPLATSAPTPVALVNRTTSLSVTDATAITWNNEVYDNESVIAVPATSMTIPSSGLYRVFSGFFTSTAVTGTTTRKNGSTVAGMMAHLGDNTTVCWGSGTTAIMSLASSDAIALYAVGGTTNYGTGSAEYTSFGLERLDASTQYALVRKSSDQTSFTSGNVSFDTEVADTDSFHSTVTNNERLTVPGGGYTRVRLGANIEISSGTAIEGEITKNGSGDVRGLPCRRRSLGALINLASPPINISTADYFAVSLSLGASRSIKNADDTWFSIEEVPTAVKSCLVYPSSGQLITTSDAKLSWDSEDHDPDGMHSTVTNTTRLTVPSGCTYARVHFQLKGQLNSTARVQAQVTKNNAGVTGTAVDDMIGASGAYQRLGGCTGWVQVTPGDYFELLVACSTGTVTTTPGGCWFAMECI